MTALDAFGVIGAVTCGISIGLAAGPLLQRRRESSDDPVVSCGLIDDATLDAIDRAVGSYTNDPTKQELLARKLRLAALIETQRGHGDKP